MAKNEVLGRVEAAVEDRKSAQAELVAVARVLAAHGWTGLPIDTQSFRYPDGKSATIYVWKDTPAGDFALVTGPQVKGTILTRAELAAAADESGIVFAPGAAATMSGQQKSAYGRASERGGRAVGATQRGASASARSDRRQAAEAERMAAEAARRAAREAEEAAAAERAAAAAARREALQARAGRVAGHRDRLSQEAAERTRRAEQLEREAAAARRRAEEEEEERSRSRAKPSDDEMMAKLMLLIKSAVAEAVA